MTNSETYLTADGELAPVAVLDHEQTGIEPGYRIVPVADGLGRDRGAERRAARGAVHGRRRRRPGGAAGALASRASDELLAALEAAGIPAERVRENQRDAFFDSAQNQAAGLVARYPHPIYGSFEQPGALWSFGDLDVRLDRAPPTVGQHSVEILEEVGFDRAEIDRLVGEGVVVSGSFGSRAICNRWRLRLRRPCS